jgi:hypothetical protein
VGEKGPIAALGFRLEPLAANHDRAVSPDRIKAPTAPIGKYNRNGASANASKPYFK